jgi:predicted ATP-grasp superfamily ATP-dependent carboligase
MFLMQGPTSEKS